jgi:hypothetical protein
LQFLIELIIRPMDRDLPGATIVLVATLQILLRPSGVLPYDIEQDADEQEHGYSDHYRGKHMRLLMNEIF